MWCLLLLLINQTVVGSCQLIYCSFVICQQWLSVTVTSQLCFSPFRIDEEKRAFCIFCLHVKWLSFLYTECWLLCWCGSTLEHLSSCGILSHILILCFLDSFISISVVDFLRCKCAECMQCQFWLLVKLLLLFSCVSACMFVFDDGSVLFIDP